MVHVLRECAPPPRTEAGSVGEPGGGIVQRGAGLVVAQGDGGAAVAGEGHGVAEAAKGGSNYWTYQTQVAIRGSGGLGGGPLPY